ILVGAHAENGGHPVGRISAKVLLDALSRVICLILVEIDDISEMDVEVHQTGDHVLPCKVRRLDLVGYSQLSDRANPDHAPVFDQHAGVLDGWRTGSIDEREIRIGLDVLARRAGACSIAASDRKRRNYTQPPAISHHSPSLWLVRPFTSSRRAPAFVRPGAPCKRSDHFRLRLAAPRSSTIRWRSSAHG